MHYFDAFDDKGKRYVFRHKDFNFRNECKTLDGKTLYDIMQNNTIVSLGLPGYCVEWRFDIIGWDDENYPNVAWIGNIIKINYINDDPENEKDITLLRSRYDNNSHYQVQY